MQLFARLEAPSFDLCWLDTSSTSYALIPGGGGASKTGVKNLIHIAQFTNKGIIFQKSIITDTIINKDNSNSNLCTAIYSRSFNVCYLLSNYSVDAYIYKQY